MCKDVQIFPWATVTVYIYMVTVACLSINLLFFFSLVTSLSPFQLLLSPLSSVPQSSLLHSLRVKPSSGFISIGGGEIKATDPGRGVVVVVIVVVEDRWISGRVLKWVRVGNLVNREHGVLFVGVDFSLNGSDQPWVSAWMALGFGLIWALINHENKKQKIHKAWVWEIWVSAWWWLGDDDGSWV